MITRLLTRDRFWFKSGLNTYTDTMTHEQEQGDPKQEEANADDDITVRKNRDDPDPG